MRDCLLSAVPPTWASRVVFALGERRYTLLEVIQAAEVRGELGPISARFSHAHALALAAAEQGLEPDMAQVEAAVDEFRYARNLVTVEETERWLDERGLTADDLSDHFLRRYWQAAPALQGSASPLLPAEIVPAWPVDLLISGEFDRLSRRLAGEAACALRQEPSPGMAVELLNRFKEARGFKVAAYEAWRDAAQLTDAQVAAFLHGQQLFAAERDRALTAENRLRLLAEQRTALTRLVLDVVEFDLESAAQEAFLCVTTDGLSLETLADESGFPVRRSEGFLRDFPEPWRVALVGAGPGRILRPVANGETHSLCRVCERQEPRLEHPQVAAELDAQLLRRHVGELESREITWALVPEDRA